MEEVSQHPSKIQIKEFVRAFYLAKQNKKNLPPPAKAVGNFKDFYNVSIPQYSIISNTF